MQAYKCPANLQYLSSGEIPSLDEVLVQHELIGSWSEAASTPFLDGLERTAPSMGSSAILEDVWEDASQEASQDALQEASEDASSNVMDVPQGSKGMSLPSFFKPCAPLWTYMCNTECSPKAS